MRAVAPRLERGEISVNSKASRQFWLDAFRKVRVETERRSAPLSPEDQVIQSMPDTSPTKWHRAHVTWFFETFLLVPHAPDYKIFDQRFPFLFNSYYVAAGPRHARPKRGLITRPNAQDVTRYRGHVDQAVAALIEDANETTLATILPIVEIGLHHEQQHQELLITDIMHAFSQNPTNPAYDADWSWPESEKSAGGFAELPSGIHAIGYDGDGFCFDNERPVHRVLLPGARIARDLVTNAEWLKFIAAGGYATPHVWLSDGWLQVESEGWEAPGYWRQIDGEWFALTPAGLQPLNPAAPVFHVSYFDADAFARRAGQPL